MSHPFYKRILKEFQKLQNNPLPGITLIENDSDLSSFSFDIKLLDLHPIYKPEDVYYLNIRITKDYPVDSPQVKFILKDSSKIPIHPHIYSNGHICLNLLGTDWTPACSMQSILLSIQSMLSTNLKDERPVDNDNYVRYAPSNPKLSGFVYHDDNV